MISTTLFNKYKTGQFEHAAHLVNEFYLGGKDKEQNHNGLKYLEDLPDVEEVAARKEAERIAAEEEAAENAAFGEDLEEVDVHGEDPVGLSFSDSGYGSVVGDSPSKDTTAGGPSVSLSPGGRPGPPLASSPRKPYPLPDGIPPLNLPTASPL